MIEENESMNDPKNDPRLTAYVMGELSADDAQKVEQSLAESPELAVVVDEIRSTIGALESAFAGEPSLGLSAEQKLAIETAAHSGDSTSEEDSLVVRRSKEDLSATVSRPWGRWLLVAAIGTVLIGGSVFLANPNNRAARQAVQNEAISHNKISSAKAAVSEGQADEVSATGVDKPAMPEGDFAASNELIQSTVDDDRWSESDSGESASQSTSQKLPGVDVAQNQKVFVDREEELGRAKQEYFQKERFLRSDLAQTREASGSSVEDLERLSSMPMAAPGGTTIGDPEAVE